MGIALFTSSLFLLVFDTLAKERVFEDEQKRLGRPLDIFVVNSYGSAAQAVFVLLMLPLLAALRGIAPGQLPDYLHQGGWCFGGCVGRVVGERGWEGPSWGRGARGGAGGRGGNRREGEVVEREGKHQERTGRGTSEGLGAGPSCGYRLHKDVWKGVGLHIRHMEGW